MPPEEQPETKSGISISVNITGLTEKEFHKLWREGSKYFGLRDNPRSAWTNAEKRTCARLAVLHLVAKFVEDAE